MRLYIHLSLDSAAFDEAPMTEAGRILRKLAAEFEAEAPEHVTLRDLNGNTVGMARIER